jgi:hypothetical protein
LALLVFASWVPAQTSPPTQVADAFQRIEELFRSPTTHQPAEWTRHVNDHYESKPVPDATTVTVDTQGLQSVAPPFMLGQAIVWDFTGIWERKVSDLGSDGHPHQTSTQVNHILIRNRISLSDSGAWEFDSLSLSGGSSDSIGKPISTGSVEWLPDGFKVVSFKAEESYGPGGTVVPRAKLNETVIKREGDKLVVSITGHYFERLKTPDGKTLPTPDFSKPLGNGENYDMTFTQGLKTDRP